MNQKDIMAMQQRIRDRFAPRLAVDGFWGPMSQKTCRAYLRSMMPAVHPWPKSTQSAIRKFYGEPGDEGALVVMQFPYTMFYGGKLVKTARVHEKSTESLLRVLNSIGSSYDKARGIMEEAEDYGGIYNFRNKRGANTLSLHSWGVAIDLDADDNSFRDTWPIRADMPIEIMECFAAEGWTSAGAFWGYDAMHHQCTQP
jgi:hypothetical protein